MPLVDVSLRDRATAVPREVRSFLAEADRRIERFLFDHHVPGFVPCDFSQAFVALRAVADGNVAAGNLFCEWGSGFGVVACLAAMLEFDAHGIEIEESLVDAARILASDFGLPVEFCQGSFIPKESKVALDRGADFAWLTTSGDDTEVELGLATDDFHLIFAYPWPDEEKVIGSLFEHHAGSGALLMTYHGEDRLRLRRKERRRLARRGMKFGTKMDGS